MDSNPIIKFIATVPGLETIKDVQPVPAKDFYPQWWRKTPYHTAMNPDIGTARACPALPEYFSQGFVLPMWADTTLEHDANSTMYRWEVGRPGTPYTWSHHGDDQFLEHAPNAAMQGSKVNFVFKADCPWRMVTPPGYSILQLPLFYHFNNEFSVLPGMIHTDKYHELNQQVLLHASNKSITIARGTPFVQYIPIKRESYDLDVHQVTEEEKYYFAAKDLDLRSSSMGNMQYKKIEGSHEDF
jgi:hypothetical protein